MSQDSTTLLVNVESTKLGNGKKEFRESIQRGGTIQQHARESHVYKNSARIFGFLVASYCKAFRK
jgi:hypothetical protein